MFNKKLIKIGFISLFVLSIYVSFGNGAKLFFSPSSGEIIYNCPFDVDVMLDMEGDDTTAIDLKLMVDESRFGIMDFDGQGGVFRTYTKPKYLTVRDGVYRGINTVGIFFTTFAPPSGVQGAGRLGTLTIKPNRGVWELPLNFFFELGSKTEDSNVPVISGNYLVDGLTSVENAYFKIVEGECNYHGSASGWNVQVGGPIEIVENQNIVKGKKDSVLSSIIQMYGWYILLIIVLLALLIIFKNNKENKKSKINKK